MSALFLVLLPIVASVRKVRSSHGNSTSVRSSDVSSFADMPALEQRVSSSRIENYAPGPIKVSGKYEMCLDARNSTNVHVNRCHGGKNQAWFFRNGMIHPLHLGVGWCLDGHHEWNIYVHPCNGGRQQQWVPEDWGHFWCFRNVKYGKMMDHNEGQNNNVWMWPSHMGDNQRWIVGGQITVTGGWFPRRQITGVQTISISHGTTKRSSVTTTSEWSSSVTVSVEFGGFFTPSGSVSSTIGQHFAMVHKNEWETNTETNFSMILEGKENQQYLWQWYYEIVTDMVSNESTQTTDYAVTAYRGEMPRCLPGYCRDNPRCQSCFPGFDL